jgi:hypothetical protein
MVTGAALVWLAMHYHLVRGNDGISLVAKTSSNLSDVYVDTRGFELRDWKEHRPLALAIMKRNRSGTEPFARPPLPSPRAAGASIQSLVSGLLRQPQSVSEGVLLADQRVSE